MGTAENMSLWLACQLSAPLKINVVKGAVRYWQQWICSVTISEETTPKGNVDFLEHCIQGGAQLDTALR